ncbi:MAG: hypothetical protein H0W34_00460 [Pyrinomonadaceae bacterium]|nr:hypothetical protein [Pyrinomonadaceae bacterium]
MAHRDLKPGNILIQHPLAQLNGLEESTLWLSDIGYVADLTDLQDGSKSQSLELWRTNQVPGSQFYRAPEQWTQPIEVQMLMNSSSEAGTVFEVLSSKVQNVEPGDLLASTIVRPVPDRNRLLAITKVERAKVDTGPTKPERGPEWQKKITGRHGEEAVTEDGGRRRLLITVREKFEPQRGEITAHIVKTTGFHTDGFSFGAMLYELATGGRNPEHFYQYCLQHHQLRNNDRQGRSEAPLDLCEIVDDLVHLDRGLKRVAPRFAALFGSILNYGEFVRDVRGVPVAREILHIICASMLRGFSKSKTGASHTSRHRKNRSRLEDRGSYYHSDAKDEHDAKHQGWHASPNVEAFKLIGRDLAVVYNACSLPQDYPGVFIGKGLLLLRCLGSSGNSAPFVDSATPHVEAASLAATTP